MGSSCTTGKGKSNKKNKQNPKDIQNDKIDKNDVQKIDLENSFELKKQADIISFQHKFPVIRPLLNNDLYKSRVQTQRKGTLENISSEQLGNLGNLKKLQSKNTTSFSNMAMQSTKAVF